MNVMEEFAVAVDGWFDGEQRHNEPTTFIIRNRTVADIAAGHHHSALQQQGLRIVRGAFLIPGLTDAHVHLFLDGAQTDTALRSAHLKQSTDELQRFAAQAAKDTLACGVTWVRDAGDRHGINHRIRTLASAADCGMTRVRSGGLGVKRAKRYGAFMARDVDDAQSIRTSVTDLARDNDEIKIILTGIIDFDSGSVTDQPQFNAQELKLIVDTAQNMGRQTFAHCSGIRGLEVATQARIGSIEHGFFMTRDILMRMADHGIAWTPTFCPVHFQWAHPEAAGWQPSAIAHMRRILDDHAHHLQMVQELGVTLLLGTDAGSMGVPHGHAVFDEIDRYLEAGLSLQATLQAATTNAYRHFGRADVTLRRGGAFDAILLPDSPWDNLNALKQPLEVWRQDNRSPP